MAHDVVFALLPGVTLLDIAGPGDALAEANRCGADYRLRYVAVTTPEVATSAGIALRAELTVNELCTHNAPAPDRRTLIVPGGPDFPHYRFEDTLLDSVRLIANISDRVVSVCTGAFLLAAAGLLEGARATTHWRYTETLARRFPGVRVEPDALFVQDGHLATSAGITAGIDLTLALVEADHGADMARDVARALVVHMQRAGGQSQFSAPLQWPRPTAPVLREVTDAVIAAPAKPHTPATLAAQLHVSTRHLARLFRDELGISPARFIERVRLDAARSLLDAGHTVTDAAQLAGFSSDDRLRRVFGATFGVSPREYRDRFGGGRASLPV